MTSTRLTPEDYSTAAWSGGVTTELLIRPRGARYADRDFLFRVSSATVDLEESSFTALPDYDRLIATLEGTISLSHDGGPALTLAPFEVYAFDGGSDTRCQGRCRDFNLMLRKGRAKGSLLPLTVSGVFALSLSPDTQTALLFCVSGPCAANGVPLSPGDSLLLEGAANEVLTLQSAAARLMLVQVAIL